MRGLLSKSNIVLLLLILAGSVFRLEGISRSLEHDEVVTFREYASRPWSAIVTSYEAPNNHILHSLCVKLSTGLFGSGEWAIRLPTALAGCLGIWGIYLLGLRLQPRRSERKPFGIRRAFKTSPG